MEQKLQAWVEIRRRWVAQFCTLQSADLSMQPAERLSLWVLGCAPKARETDMKYHTETHESEREANVHHMGCYALVHDGSDTWDVLI